MKISVAIAIKQQTSESEVLMDRSQKADSRPYLPSWQKKSLLQKPQIQKTLSTRGFWRNWIALVSR
jgi:hypothetical protein